MSRPGRGWLGACGRPPRAPSLVLHSGGRPRDRGSGAGRRLASGGDLRAARPGAPAGRAPAGRGHRGLAGRRAALRLAGPVRASRHQALARPDRRLHPAMPVSRLGLRRRRPLRADSGAGGQAAIQGAGQDLSRARALWPGLGRPRCAGAGPTTFPGVAPGRLSKTAVRALSGRGERPADRRELLGCRPLRLRPRGHSRHAGAARDRRPRGCDRRGRGRGHRGPGLPARPVRHRPGRLGVLHLPRPAAVHGLSAQGIRQGRDSRSCSPSRPTSRPAARPGCGWR